LPESTALSTVAAAEVAAGPLVWGGLLAFLAAMIVVDLRVGAADQEMSVRRAAGWSAVWFGLAIAFGAGLWAFAGGQAGESYFAGYVMEKALSLDNVFVFTLIFAALAVPREQQPRLLLYGILAALVLRGVFIFAGAEALERFGWVAWPFAALLAYTGVKILRPAGDHDEGADIVDRIRRRFPRRQAGGAGAARDRVRRRAVRGRQRPGHPGDHHRHVRRLRRQRVRADGPARAVLPRRRPGHAVRVPPGGAGRAADRHRREARVRGGHRRQDPTAVTLGSIVGVLAVAILASLFKERRDDARIRMQEG
jgi:hypothetical protein